MRGTPTRPPRPRREFDAAFKLQVARMIRERDVSMERVWQRSYANHGEAIADIANYIVAFYNTHRLHSTLGYRSPTNYEQATA